MNKLTEFDAGVLKRLRSALEPVLPAAIVTDASQLATGRDAILWTAARHSVLADIDAAIRILEEKDKTNGLRSRNARPAGA